MTTRHTTECIYEIPDGWSDETGYIYSCGEVEVVAGPFATLETWQPKVEDALEKFRTSVPGYELVERKQIDKPVPGAELISLRVGGKINVFELSILWPIGDAVWAFRSRGPQSAEESCREAAESFLQTYQPVGLEEET